MAGFVDLRSALGISSRVVRAQEIHPGKQLRMAVNFNAYHEWLGIPAEEQPADHYRLLGVKRFVSRRSRLRFCLSRTLAWIHPTRF